MSIEPRADDGRACAPRAPDEALGSGPSDRAHPNLSGDLPTLLQTGPMFRRALAGYDRFQVDTYVRWAEDELVAADRQREHLLTRHLETQAALAEARTLLSHSSAGGELLQVSRRIGSMLAAAADEAETIKAEAENHRSVARAQAAVITADAGRVLADAQAEAARLLAETTAEVAAMTRAADLVVAEAEQTRRDARAQSAQRLEEAHAIEQRAVERAEQIREQALAEALAARDAARAEVLRMLDTAREQRRRADAEAAAVRERLDRDSARRRASLLEELAQLEHRRDALRTELDAAPEPLATPHIGLHLHVRAYLDRIQDRLRRHLAAGGSSPNAVHVAGDDERTAA